MRNVNCNVLSGAACTSANGIQIDANQLISASFQASFTDATAAGTFKLQASNDICTDRYQASNFTVTHWIDIPSETAAITTGNSALLTIPTCTYRWLRAVWADTAAGVQTVTTRNDVSGLGQIASITCVADTGSFSSFTLHCPAKAGATQADYFIMTGPTGLTAAVWLNINGAGTPPTGAAYLASDVQVVVDIVNGDTAVDVAAAVTGVAGAIGFSPSDNVDGTVTFTQGGMGVCAAPTRHNADDTGNGSFSFSGVAAGTNSNLNSSYFTLWSANNAQGYYVWYDVNGEGVDPALAGKIGIQVSIPAGTIADDVATDSTGPIAAISGGAPFNANASTDTLLIYNLVFGPATHTADGAAATGFTFSTPYPGYLPGFLLASKYFFINAGNNGVSYVVWYYNTTDSTGVDPALPGTTSVEVDFASNDTADTIATLTAAALDALAAFVSTAATNVVTCTNAATGPFVPASDHNTTFTFAVTGGGSGTVIVNMNALSM